MAFLKISISWMPGPIFYMTLGVFGCFGLYILYKLIRTIWDMLPFT